MYRRALALVAVVAAAAAGDAPAGPLDGPPPADAAAQGEPYVDCTTLPGGCAPGKQSVDGTGAEDPTVVKNDQTPKDGQGAGGVDIDGRK